MRESRKQRVHVHSISRKRKQKTALPLTGSKAREKRGKKIFEFLQNTNMDMMKIKRGPFVRVEKT
jgi:hypothetical protein